VAGDIELGPAGIAPIAPVTTEEAHQAAPEGFHVKGVSTLYDGAGNIVQQWIKTKQEETALLEAFEKAVKRIAEPVVSLADPRPVPAHALEDLLCVVPVGDSHIGMHAWGVETGDDFDLEIAERNMAEAFDRLLALAPAAETLLLIDLGDVVHSDDPSNRTAKSGHALDVDTRWSKVIEVVIRVWRRCIDRALTKFGRVISWNVGGNHDPNSAVVLRHVFRAMYEREPRVTVELTPGKYLWHRFGETLIGSTHGDTVKLPDLPSIMACDRAKDWGETKFRHWYTGHVHHDQTKEYRGCVVETFRTLAPKDAWHAAQGYRSGRDIKLDVFHRRWGRINRHIVGIEQITSEAA
jgi:hypothetical protein